MSFKNVADLDSSNSDDTATYLGIDYSLGLRSEFKGSGPAFYLKLERNGPFDYDAPLFVHNTLMNSGGRIEAYRNDELLPELEEFWLDIPVFNPIRFKAGLYTYEVGNGFSLNGAYENYGFTIFRESQDFSWRLYYGRPDINHRSRLGPHIRQDKEQDIAYEPNAANFFAADVKFKKGNHLFWPYLGALVDYTSPGKRDNSFTTPIKRDILGTFGLSWNWRQDNLSWVSEMAHNFGKGSSADSAYKDIYHTGYLAYTDIGYSLGKLVPSMSFLLCSGNKAALEMAVNQDTTLTSGKNRAFSYASPLNKNLDDAISASHSDIRPVVAMGSGYGLNYGVPRPRTFASSDFDNIVIASLGLDLDATEKLKLSLDGYYLRSFTRAVGMFNGEAKYLSPDLGREVDLSIDYQLNKNILIGVLGGCFFPGAYYQEERDDTQGSLFSPFLRGDGEANSAYQVEIAMEFKF